VNAMLLPNRNGGYSFLRGIGPYSAGVVAAPGFAIEHVRLSHAVPLDFGFFLVDGHLKATGRPRAALCAMALRSPTPFTFPGFDQFNARYIDVLKSWDLFVDGVNPIARTNVAPEVDPPHEPSLYSFAYTVPELGPGGSFVVAGAGELPEGSLNPRDVVPGDIPAKARFVLGLMEARLHGLGRDWDDVTITNIYTVHDLPTPEILARIGPAARHGLTWHFTRPPIVTIEFEMDLRGVARESVLRQHAA
jgi:hypothetical protein